MELTLSHDDPISTDLLTADGLPLYTISTPLKWPHRTTTIMKYVLDGDERPTGENTELARIHWHYFGNSRIIFNGQILDSNAFMPYKGLLRRVRTFVGLDGKSYKWTLGWLTSTLELDEESSEASCVVKMRQRNVIQGTKSALEIDDTVAHMLDLVIVTWVFVERRRRDQEYKDVGV